MALTASQVLSQIGSLLAEEAFQAFNPVIGATLADIAANPSEWTNPATAAVKGAAAVANLTAALPTLEGSAVTGAAQLVATLWNAVGTKVTPVATPPATTAPTTAQQAVSIGTEIAGIVA